MKTRQEVPLVPENSNVSSAIIGPPTETRDLQRTITNSIDRATSLIFVLISYVTNDVIPRLKRSILEKSYAYYLQLSQIFIYLGRIADNYTTEELHSSKLRHFSDFFFKYTNSSQHVSIYTHASELKNIRCAESLRL